MRKLIVMMALGMEMVCVAQTWKHERLLTTDFKGDGAFAFNRSGSVIYSPWVPVEGGGEGRYPQAFKDRTNLTQMYLPPLSMGFAGAINDAGQVAWRGRSSTSLHVMVDGHDYFSDVYPPLMYPPYDVVVKGIDDAGKPFWLLREHQGTPVHVFRGTEELSAGKTVYDPTLSHMNRNGDAVWSATIQTDTGYEYDNFLNRDNISEMVLGADRAASGDKPDINNHGLVLWTGRGVNTNNRPTLFVGETAMYTDPGGAPPESLHITDSGHFLWIKVKSNGAIVMRDLEDISTPVFGEQPYTALQGQIFMGESGDVVWQGTELAANVRVIYRNQQDLSSGMIGIPSQFGDQVQAVGVDDLGNALWWGAGPGTEHLGHVFVNDFDLSRDALGLSESRWARAITIGPAGHVLWIAVDQDGVADWYVSTPVPEPSLIGVLTVMGLVEIGRRRRS